MSVWSPTWHWRSIHEAGPFSTQLQGERQSKRRQGRKRKERRGTAARVWTKLFPLPCWLNSSWGLLKISTRVTGTRGPRAGVREGGRDEWRVLKGNAQSPKIQWQDRWWEGERRKCSLEDNWKLLERHQPWRSLTHSMRKNFWTYVEPQASNPITQRSKGEEWGHQALISVWMAGEDRRGWHWSPGPNPSMWEAGWDSARLGSNPSVWWQEEVVPGPQIANSGCGMQDGMARSPGPQSHHRRDARV